MPETLICPICKQPAVLYMSNGKTVPYLQKRIENHIESHSVADLLSFVEDNMVQQALKIQDEIDASSKTKKMDQP